MKNRIGVMGVIGAIGLILVALPLFGEGGEKLQETNWLHIGIGGAYIPLEQGLEFCGVERETSEYTALSLVLLANIGKEYYDYRFGGVSSLSDLELTLIGIVSSYYVNKGLNAIFRPKPYRSYRTYRTYKKAGRE